MHRQYMDAIVAGDHVQDDLALHSGRPRFVGGPDAVRGWRGTRDQHAVVADQGYRFSRLVQQIVEALAQPFRRDRNVDQTIEAARRLAVAAQFAAPAESEERGVIPLVAIGLADVEGRRIGAG